MSVFLSIGRHLVLTLFILFSISQIGFATDYYVSSSTGNDSRGTLEAQNPATPWKSIDKLNSVSSTIKGGDRIFFKAGDVFYGTIKITKSGSSNAPIQFGSYGTGAKPIITSLVKINNLVSVGSGKYEADLSAFNLARVQIALINDQIKEVGRHPNAGTANGGYLTISNVNSNTSISTSAANPFSGTSGDVVIRKNNWIIDRHAITSINSNTISFKTNESHYTPLKNHGYFLQNHPSILDLPGEWSYDPATKKLTVNLTGYNMSTVNVSVATLDNLVTNNQFTTNFTFSNIHFKGANTHLLNISKSENVKIENCLLEYAGENAISSYDVKGYVIQNNQINYALNSSIFIAHSSPGTIIKGNAITYNFPFQGMVRPSDLAGVGIYLGSDGDGSLIEKNSLINSGFNGIHFGGSNTKVINNFIDSFCLYKQDGGGIYTNSDGLVGRNNVGREITGNIILNGKGTKFGTVEEVDMAEGIYLDDNSAGVKVSKNTVAFITGKGLYLHNANNIEISENLFYQAKSQVQLTHDFMGSPIRNVNVTKNQFSSIEKTYQVYSIYSSENDIGSVGSFTSNYFLDPFNNDFFIHTKGSNDGSSGVARNLSNWTTNFGYDANSLRPDLSLSTSKITSTTLIKGNDFSANTAIISGVYGATSTRVSSGISGGTLKLNSNSSNNATVYMQMGAINAGDKILVEFDMIGTPANIPMEVFLEGTFNVDKGAGNGKVSTTSAAKSHQVILSSLVAKSNESVVLRFPPTATELLLDNIKISKVTIEDIDLKSLVLFDYNPTSTAVQKPLDGTYKNAKNESFSGSVTIAPFGSVLLAKISGTIAPIANQAPTISLSNPSQNQVFIQGANPVELIANAQDPEGKIKKVEFYSAGALLTTVTAPPFIYNWSTIQNGSYSVYAKVTDEENLTATSTTVNFTVKNADPVPPTYTAQITAPAHNSSIVKGSETVVLKTNASTSGTTIQKVEFFNWGFPLVTVTSGNFEFPWASIDVDTYNITAKVTDSKGLVYTTAAVKFTVTAAPAPAPAPAPPTVTFAINMALPTQNQTFTLGEQIVKLRADVTSSAQIKSIQFYNWGSPLVSVSSAPYEFDWTKIEVGNYQLYAVATDVNGQSITSQTIKFKVVAAASSSPTQIAPAPSSTVVMSQPFDNQVFELGKTPVILKANTSQTVSKVEFYNWYLPLVSVSNATNEFSWSKIEVGEYFVTARITDSQGKVIESAPVKFKVIAPANRIASADSTGNTPTVGFENIESNKKETAELTESKDASAYGIKMGPNPTDSNLNVFFDDYPANYEGVVSVLDMRGIELFKSEFNTNQVTIGLDLSFLKPGIYLVKLNFGGKNVQTRRLIKT